MQQLFFKVNLFGHVMFALVNPSSQVIHTPANLFVLVMIVKVNLLVLVMLTQSKLCSKNFSICFQSFYFFQHILSLTQLLRIFWLMFMLYIRNRYYFLVLQHNFENLHVWCYFFHKAFVYFCNNQNSYSIICKKHFFPFLFMFYVGFLSQPFTNHMTAGEGGGHFFNSSLPLPSGSQILRH